MNDKKILAGAPEGNYKSVKMLGDRPAVWVPEVCRSLADIAQIVELEQNLGLSRIALDHQKTLLVSCEAALSQRDTKIAELEKERDIVAMQLLYGVNHDSITMQKMKINFEAHNLEQQANALNEYAYSGKPLTKRGLNLEAISLNEQAKQLREGVE